ncbi:MAG: hypothetical protein V3V15_02730 [Sphingorhabdus sp.]
MKVRFLGLTLLLVGCNPAENSAVGACELFIKERLRSPSTYERVSVDFSGVSFESQGQNVKMVSIEYDAANAYGTPIRGRQQCTFEVGDDSQYLDDVDHAARMSSIRVDSGYSPCCILDRKDKMSDDPVTEIDEVEAAANDAVEAAGEAAKAAKRILGGSGQ